jgi:hypothetical protein
MHYLLSSASQINLLQGGLFSARADSLKSMFEEIRLCLPLKIIALTRNVVFRNHRLAT